MNYKLLLRILGRALQVEALCMLFPLLVSLVYREDPSPFLMTIPVLAVLGTLLSLLKSKADFFSREGFAAVGLIWVTLILFGSLPFWISGAFPSFVDCIFEIASGFTTTGATILTDIEALPRGILFWRSFSSWIGGMGVLLFTIAFLPKVGARTHVLMRAELPGPVASKLVPKTADSSKILYLIYIFFTVVETVLLRIAGMEWYDAIVTTFATVCTGGFSVKNASIAAYHSPACEWIIIAFILLCSLNFAVFFLTVTGRFRQAVKSDELKFFLCTVFLASLLIFFNVRPFYDTIGDAARGALFQVSAIISTTGFTTADYCLWPMFAQMVLLILMCFGGCSWSTTGSIKCSRILLLMRCAKRSILRFTHPRAVKVVKLDGKPVNEETLNTVLVFFLCFFLLFGAGCLVLSLDDVSMVTATTASLACLTNVGPAFDAVGPTGTYAGFSVLSKLVLSFGMVVGRLEIFPVLILLSPATWARR